MLESTKIFTYFDKRSGVTRDGETYVALNVRDKENKKNYSFLTKDPELIDKISNATLKEYQDIKIKVGFDRVFNKESRYSHWDPELLEVFNLGVQNG